MLCTFKYTFIQVTSSSLKLVLTSLNENSKRVTKLYRPYSVHAKRDFTAFQAGSFVSPEKIDFCPS